MRSTALMPVVLALVPACVFYVDPDQGGDGDDVIVIPPPDAREPLRDADRGDPVFACESPLPCPSAATNKVTVCGRLYDVETDLPLQAMAPSYRSCGSGGEATDGPCSLELAFYDALDFAGSPEGSVPLPLEEFRIDDCGRFVARNITRPALGFLGIAVDDGANQLDDHRLTALAFPVGPAQVIARQRVYSLRTTTDQQWSNAAGLIGDTFVDRGVIWKLFLHDNLPVRGVQVTSGGSPRPDDDFPFSDANLWTRSIVQPASSRTGLNGSALMLNSSLVQHSGTGGETPGCAWSSALAASIPGVLFHAPSILIDQSGMECE